MSIPRIHRVPAIGFGLIVTIGVALVLAAAGASGAATATPCGLAPTGMNVIVSDAPVIGGTPAADFICGGPSANRVLAYAGDDIVFGGGGDDELQGHQGDDTLHGESGNDTVEGGPGEDTLTGGPGRDELLGYTGNDDLNGGTGADTLLGGADDDTLSGQDGADILRGAFGNDDLRGGGGNDDIKGQQDGDTVTAGAGNDDVRGGGGDDMLNGGADNDVIQSGGGNDQARGDAGDDIVGGGVGDDFLWGGAGTDHNAGGDGLDQCLTAETTSGCEWTAANSSPVAGDDTAELIVGDTILIDVLDNDSDADPFDPISLISVDDSAAAGSAAISSGMVAYDPGTAFDGLGAGESDTDSFEYTINDTRGGSASATVTVTVSADNFPPELDPISATVNENSIIEIEIVGEANDPEGGPLTLTEVDDTGTVGGVAQNTTSVTFTAKTFFETLDTGETATDTFTVTVADDKGATVTQTVTVTVTGVNDTPVAEDDDLTTDEDDVLNGSLFADNGSGPDFDIDGDAISVNQLNGDPVAGPTELVLDSGSTADVDTDGSFTITPDATLNGLAVGDEVVDTFTYTIFDANSTSTPADVTITFVGTNDDPVARTDFGRGFETNEDTPIEIFPLENDTDPDADSLIIESFDASAVDSTVTASSPWVLDFDPTAAHQGLDTGETVFETINYTVGDPFGGSDDSVIVMRVDGLNDTPVAIDDPVSTTENEPVSGN
ncbi:MAG: Ig-like domain-containing protein, partial [Acidimicrobiia bacterium]|nr:Ig-like domain-containing protein [Acidimicrobiia bacterium]